MSVNTSNAGWICSLVVALLTTGQLLHADDKTAQAGDTKTVPVTTGKGTAAIKVKEANPYKNLHVPPPGDADHYDPRNYSMNQTSSMANKPFSADNLSLSKKSASLSSNQNDYSTKSYGKMNGADNINRKYSTMTSSDSSHSDSQFAKNYATAGSDMGSSSSSGFSKTSTDQNRSATLGGDKSKVFASDLSKQYLGPGAQHVPDGLVKENVVISHVRDIPNRPLTIGEVRGLINHGFKPDLDEKPDESGKALNDPNYKPEAAPEPIDSQSAPVPPDDDKNSPLPSPGVMAQPPPENSVPLPQH